MSHYHFSIRTDIYPSSEKDREATICIEKLFIRQKAKPYIKSDDKRPNIDGTINILDNNGEEIANVKVQLKSYPQNNRGLNKYSIPSYILGYAERMRGEIVIFIAADYDENKFYWKYISDEYIEECAHKGIQQSYTYHFKEEEITTTQNIVDTINSWYRLHQQKCHLIGNKKSDIASQIGLMRVAFNSVNSNFYGIEHSYIHRKEVDSIYQWIKDDNHTLPSGCALLTGEAGCGKSVVIKEIINQLEKEEIPYIAIKADMCDSGIYAIDKIYDTLGYLLSNKDKAVIIIDQIDALSQSLSNDRTRLNELVSLIKEYSEYRLKDVRIIISCREFDITYDPVLASLRDIKRNRTFVLGQLDNEEVKGILQRLNSNCEYDNRMIEVLRNAQNLDTYCRISSYGDKKKNYHSRIELYDALCDKVIYRKASTYHLDSGSIETLIYQLAQKMLVDETLSPTFNRYSSAKEIDYLASEGIIYTDGTRIKFFHQSFYDYVLARSYIQQNKSLTEELLNGHQGLYIRSQIKFVLEFLRDYNETLYKNDLERLLSPTTRTHLQQLVLGIMSQYDDIRPYEQAIIKQIKETNPSVFGSFISRHINSAWLPFLRTIIIDDFTKLTCNDSLFNRYMHFCFSNTTHNEPYIYDLIDNIQDADTRDEMAKRCLYRVNDYQTPKVIEWYKYLQSKKTINSLALLRNIQKSNPDLACEQVGVLLKKYIEEYNITQYYSRSNPDRLLEFIEEYLIDNHPQRIYPILRDCMLLAVKQHQYHLPHYEVIDNNHFFLGIDTGDNHDKIIKWLCNILTSYIDSNIDFVHHEIELLLESTSEVCYVIALDVMRHAPQQFIKQFIQFTHNLKLIDDLARHSETQYYLYQYLSSTFPYLSQQEKEEYIGMVDKFQSRYDYVKDCNRRLGLLLPILGCNKRLLLHTIPAMHLPQRMRMNKLALDRRYKKEPVVTSPDSHHIVAAHTCGGLTTHNEYLNFSAKDWRNSIYKLNEHNNSSSGKNRYLDIRRHIEEFELCIAQRCNDLGSMAMEIVTSQDATIDIRYKIAALNGLLKAQTEIPNLGKIVEQLITQPLDNGWDYQMFKLLKNILHSVNDSHTIDRIIDYCERIATLPFTSDYTTDIENKPFDNTSLDLDLLSRGINSQQGRALHTLIGACIHNQYRENIYNRLIEMHDTLGVELRLVVLYDIYVREYYDKDLFNALLQKYLQHDISDILIAQQNGIFNHWVDSPHIVEPYFRKIIHHRRAQSILAPILFITTQYDGIGEISEELLSTIIQDNDESAAVALIRMCCKSINKIEYRSISAKILRQYIHDEREEIQDTLLLHCDELPAAQFELVEEWLNNIHPSGLPEKYNSVIDYLKKCALTYPARCFRLLKNRIPTTNDIVDKEYIELLFSIYKYSHQCQDLDMMDEIMNTFDALTLKCNNSYINELTQCIDNGV